jgi:hypothetical protein
MIVALRCTIRTIRVSYMQAMPKIPTNETFSCRCLLIPLVLTRFDFNHCARIGLFTLLPFLWLYCGRRMSSIPRGYQVFQVGHP